MPSLIRMVPGLIASGIWRLACVCNGTLFTGSLCWRLDVSAGLDLCNWSSFNRPFLVPFFGAGTPTRLFPVPSAVLK